MLTPFDIPAGVVKTKSPNSASGRFTDSDKIRFVNGKPEKWMGWEKLIDDTLVGVARGAVSWSNSYGVQNLAFGTHLKLYVVQGGDRLKDITPIRSTGTLGANPFATNSGSSIVTVTDTTHGANQYDFVTFTGASAVGGITIDGQYQIVRKLDADTYTIEHTRAATSTATGGGSSVHYSYEINTGNANTIGGLGWGAGPWGAGAWGEPRSSAGITLFLRTWSLAEYGNELLASPSNGTLYLWEEGVADQAVAVTNAPTSARAMFVTGERFPLMLGTTSPMTVQWPDRDDITDWTPSAANTANIRTLQSGSKLVAGTALIDLVSLVWSDTSCYLFQYTGSEFVYDDRLVGSNCGLLGPLAFAKTSGAAYWMSGNGFHVYNGSVGPIQNAEDVRAYVFSDMDPEQATKTWCIFDQKNNQIRWGYASYGASDPDKYVDVNLTDYSWTVGTIDRTCGCIYQPMTGKFVMVGTDGDVYEHDVGYNAEGEVMDSYVQFGFYNLSNANQTVDIFGFVPDCQRQTGDLSVEFWTKDRPDDADYLDTLTITISEGEGRKDIRVSGRHFGFLVRSNSLNGDFRLGTVGLDVVESGQR